MDDNSAVTMTITVRLGRYVCISVWAVKHVQTSSARTAVMRTMFLDRNKNTPLDGDVHAMEWEVIRAAA